MIKARYNSINTMLTSPVRQIRARAELLKDSALLNSFTYTDKLISFTIDRVGDNTKFYGYGICHRLNIKLIDTNRQLSINTSNTFDIAIGAGSEYIYPFPHFYVSETHRSETTNELSITAYDKLYKAAEITIADIELNNYSIKGYLFEVAAALGVPVNYDSVDFPAFDTYYPTGANFSGEETLREVLDYIAEATQSIYYLNSEGELTFKRLDREGEAVYTIDSNSYFTLDSNTNRRLSEICHTTELGDNVAASLPESGTAQYIRDNPFYNMREDIGVLIDNALAAIGGLTINQFNCSWRGNCLIEIGDKIALIGKDGSKANSFLLDDTITYNGVFSQNTKWSYTSNDGESASNPTTLGDTLKQTSAKVDKVNKYIELIASNTDSNTQDISSLLINTDSISSTVSRVEQDMNDSFESVNGDIEELTKSVEAVITADAVDLKISQALDNGIDKVETSTGYKFDADGLTVSKSDSEMTTQITEDGMKVFKNNEAVLTANNVGVDAINLHATTYLIIGNNSRIEDYGSNRTGCFWIGGNN